MYDSAGQALAQVDALGNRWSSVYDRAGQAVAQEDPLGQRSTTVYDPRGLPSASVDALGYRTTVMHDALGRQVANQDARGYVSTVMYDPAGRTEATQNPLNYRVTQGYDSAGQMIAVEDARGYRTTFGYDPTGRQAYREGPLGRRLTTLYDALGQTTATEDAKAQRATYQYSARGEQLTALYADQSRITLQYDALGQTLEARDRSGITTQVWDERGLLARVLAPSHPGGAPLTYGFDALGQRTALALAGNRHTFQYDALGRNDLYVDPDSGRATWLYDAAGRMTEQLNPNGTATTWTHDAVGRITGIRHRKSDGSTLGVDLYSHDPNGNPLTKATLGGINTWAYDPLNQLTAEQHEIGLLATWSYDPNGNRLTQDRTQGGIATHTDYVYDRANQLLTATEGAQITSFVFDANGNQERETTGGAITSYTWEPRNLLTGVAVGAQQAVYQHRYDGLRSNIDPGTGDPATRLVWDPLGPTGYVDLLAEVEAGEALLRQYWRGAVLASVVLPTGSPTVLLDHLGSAELLVDGLSMESLRWSAWGSPVSSSGPNWSCPLGFLASGSVLASASAATLLLERLDAVSSHDGRGLTSPASPAGARLRTYAAFANRPTRPPGYSVIGGIVTLGTVRWQTLGPFLTALWQCSCAVAALGDLFPIQSFPHPVTWGIGAALGGLDCVCNVASTLQLGIAANGVAPRPPGWLPWLYTLFTAVDCLLELDIEPVLAFIFDSLILVLQESLVWPGGTVSCGIPACRSLPTLYGPAAPELRKIVSFGQQLGGVWR